MSSGDHNHIIIRPDARKIELLEEFLHATQIKFGILDKLGHHAAEINVKDFMIKHQKMINLSQKDIDSLVIMRDSYINSQ
ncbi:hypothetical protein [Oscillatoria acuminata]|uniref:Uncharacterized protein n=1 Tax=Oscillatoria acuminata PCC 6304 TaxID=56110 RepID=K9TN72_9CYAN|nr:hypothetical protein [Oscillatoria acuminata]AFY83606.1 hypothetical protein Oscil6304_4077 [Oscillatoria acuminata PCC 6304]